MTRRAWLAAAAGAASLRGAAGARPTFLGTGQETYILDAAGIRVWEFPEGSRDAWALPNGNILMAVNRRENYGGGVVEATRDGKELFRFDGRQSEVNTVQPLPGGRILLTEAGDEPVVLEIDRNGEILHEMRIDAQTSNHHLQTRMTRKLPNGNYLVPQMGEREVREYAPEGKVVWRFATPHWPFTAIRLPDGNTLTTCTQDHSVMEVDKDGKTVWRASNGDLPEPMMKGMCGCQRLANGNTVFTSYQGGAEGVKIFELTRDKNVVWTYRDGKPFGVHHFQVLGPDALPPPGPVWR
jgi:outer membrane protein assembly factor BamB